MKAELLVRHSNVFIKGRKIHFQSCGCGPAVFVLHGSPQSSRAVLPLVRYLASQGFCAIAPDTPGYGSSHPLSTNQVANNTTLDYAKSLLALADALEISHFGLYGFHTGAAIACTLAAIAPLRVTALTCDGLTAWTNEERNTILQGYLPPFNPQWDGSHMTWLWARIEEQIAFFPWHIAEDRCRMDFDMSPVERLHGNCMDVLKAGDGYRHAYHAAFTFRTESWLPKIGCPQHFACLTIDPLAEHYKRPVFEHYQAATYTKLEEMYASFAQILRTNPGSSYQSSMLTGLDSEMISHGWTGEPEAALAWFGTLRHTQHEPTIVLLHQSGGNKEEFTNLVRLLSVQRNVLAFDLPGHGESDDLASPPDSVAQIGEYVVKALNELNVSHFNAIGRGVGALVAAWLVASDFAHKGAAIDLPRIPEQYKDTWATRYCDDLTPVWDGAHLVRAFRIARWERIFFPWFDRTVSARKTPVALLEPDSIHQRACSLLKAGTAWPAAVKAETSVQLEDLAITEGKFSCFDIAAETSGQDCIDWQAAIVAL